ncbi:MAG: hypothetical protein MUF04_09565 [Akkermansiaceae bacterium]|nr:hypothetical protein [Akkermansiaceae bacterium]
MRTLALILAASVAVPTLLVSCANKDPEDRQAVPPPSANSDIPWNSQGPQGGVGGFGMLPQNRTRR